MKQLFKRKYLAYPYLVWLLIMIVAPVLLIVIYAITGKIDGRTVFTLENIKNAFDPLYLGVLGRSLWQAFIATVGCLLIGFPVAWKLSQMPPQKSAVISVFFILPMWMNFLLRTYAWMALLDTDGVIWTIVNTVAGWFGKSPIILLYNEPSVIMGMIYNYLPFMILPIFNTLQKIPQANIEAAQDLGANDRVVFRRVILPATIPGVISGITMVFIPAITTFAISRLLGGAQYMLYGDLIENQFMQVNDWNLGSALSLILIVLVFLSMWIMNKVDKDGASESGTLL